MNLYPRIAYLARYQPSKIAIETPQQRLTYLELDVWARRIAGLLRACGVKNGDLVGLRLRDTPLHIAAFFAVMRVGGVILPLDWRGARREFDRVVGQFRPRIILSDDNPLLDWSPEIVDLSRSSEFDPDDEPLGEAPDGAMALTMTSGTTGEPKAMVATHDQTYARLVTRGLEGLVTANDFYLTTLPLAYLAGREHALNPLILGATLMMFPTLFAPQELVDTVNARNITAFNMSPNMSRALLGLKVPEGQLLMPNVRTMISTTGKLDQFERSELRRRVVPRLIDYYGSSGTGPVAVNSKEGDDPESTAVGHIAIGVEVEIVDNADANLGVETVGRIRIRGPSITTKMMGVGENEEGYRDGWYYPGDLGRIDGSGILHLHGRSADLIKRGGLMVHAQEVEGVLRKHPAVVDVAIVGVPSDTLGQEVVAFLQVRSVVDLKEITRFCRNELAPYKIPSRIEILEALPRNSSGKVVKSALLS